MSNKKTKQNASSIVQKEKKHHYREEYLVQVTIMEARQLKGKDASGTSDPFVKITVGNLSPQVTTTAQGAASAVWNQSFTFTNLFINDIEFEKFEILIEVIDMNKFATNSLIGHYSIGLATLYRSSNHELYNTWLALTNPKNNLEPQGFLLVSAYIIGTDDRPPVHAINEIVYFDEEPDEFEGLGDDELTAEQLKQRRDRAKNPAVIGKPNMLSKGYQMMVNIVRGEDFPILGITTCDSFISARCCGNVLITQMAKNTQKPQFYCKLCFPVEFPVYNDKVIIRVWDKRRMASDHFIANIPELAKENDFFSLNYLQSRGGLMPFRWFNLYGIPPSERNPNIIEYIFKGNKLIEGTKYFGRILLSLSLNSHDKPVKAVQQLNAFREPPSVNYILRVDTYELQGAKDCVNTVFIEVSVGNYVCKSQKTFQKKDKEKSKQLQKKVFISDAYEWKESKIMIKEEKCDLPQDKTQIPDIIVSLFTESKFSSDPKRVAYLRIPVVGADISTNKPKWYALKSISNNLDPSVHSYILLNISLRMNVGNQEVPRIPIRRNIKCDFLFSAYLYAGYNLDPDSNSDDIETTMIVRIAHYTKELKNKKIGSNPIWNELINQVVELDENLEFASNIIVTLDNPRKKLLGLVNLFTGTIGEICVSASNCQTKVDPSVGNFSPKFQYYHVMKDGKSQGRIYAAFHLYKLPKKKTLGEEDEYKKAVEFNKKNFSKTNLEFAFIGIRNLPSPAQNPQLRIKIAIDPPSENIGELTLQQLKDKSFFEVFISPNKALLEEDVATSKLATTLGVQNPNFLEKFSKELEIPKDPKFFPVIEIEFISEGYFKSSYYTEIEIFELVDWLDPYCKSKAKLDFEEGKKPPIELAQSEAEETQLHLEHQTDLSVNEKDIKININEEKNVEKDDTKRKLLDEEKAEKNDKLKKKNDKNDDNKASKNEKNVEENNDSFHDIKGKKLDASYEDENDLFIKDDKFFNAKFEDICEFIITKEDKDEENNWRKDRIEHIKADLMALNKFDKFYDALKTKKINEILSLKNSKMSEEKFKVQDDKIGEDYNYGREVSKDDIKERLYLPYDKYELKECSILTQSFSNYTNNVRKIKQSSKGTIFLKGKINISSVQNEKEKSNKDAKSKKSKATSTVTKRSKAVSKNQKYKEDPEYPFNIFKDKFLSFFKKVPDLKTRVYILRCLNLSAQKDHIEAGHFLAGFEGKCSANSYPEILVGKGENIGDIIKCVNDSTRSIDHDLNPKYFRMFELDATLPEDWRLEIRIWNKEFIKDTLIGSVEIDLEDRLWGQPELKKRMTYQIYKEHFEKKINKLKYNFEQNTEKDKDKYRKKLSDIIGKIEIIDKDFKVPVEYLPLKNTDKNTSQGIIELFIEPFPVEVAKLIPASPIDPPQPMEFEIRLVIWETYNIFRTKGVVDIFVRVSQEAFGWVSDGIVKETDTHLGSEDGNGLFNWRMTFPLEIPCPFPRLRFAVYDMETLSSDESIGECVISFMKIIKRLRTEGKYEMQPRKLKIFHPNFPDEIRGEILVSLNIISKQEAANSPVGDGQSEPNHDPYLEAPKIGRGIGDFFKGTIFDFSLWRFCGMRALKIILASLFSLVVTLILFVKPGILVK